jgi:cytochrome c oxidase cbb3-type subunit III
MSRRLSLGRLAAAALVCAACEVQSAPSQDVALENALRAGLTPTSELEAGARAPREVAANPYEGDERAIGEGQRLYGWFNCAGCHGALGGGGIGPPLRDERWIYGSAPDQIFLSIVQGRPQGMPVYGGRIPDDTVWRIVAFVQSLGEGGAAEAPTDPGGEPQ